MSSGKGFNTQPWSFLVIKNKDLLLKLSESGKKATISILESMKNADHIC